MKFLQKLVLTTLALTVFSVQAQEKATSGKMNSTTIKTLNYTQEDGTKIPYKVTIQEQRFYQSSYEQSDKNMENWNRRNEPAQVAKLITVNSDVDNTMDRIIVLRYEKQLADTFELVPTNEGFAVEVDGHTVQYIIGEGIYFTNSMDKDFFIVDEFDMVL